MASRPRNTEFEVIQKAAQALADASGPTILKHFRKHPAVMNKAGDAGFDPVTAADRSAEKIIVKRLKEHFPDHGVVGEEFGERKGESPFQWVIDPIDGTRAFIMGSPMWGTLIGVTKGGEPYFGMIDQPFTGERFWSGGSASFMRTRSASSRRIRTRNCARLKDAILTSTHPELFEGARRRDAFASISADVRMTRYGGDCYGYALLACGFVDVIIESGLKPYDVVALIPIIERAGGVITNWDGAAATGGGDIVAAGDRRLHDIVLMRLSKSR